MVLKINIPNKKKLIIKKQFLFFKIFRYWPEVSTMKEYGKSKVRNLMESHTPHYTLREFLVTMEGSSAERKVYHYHFQVSL